MKKNSLIVVVAILVCVTIVSLSGCALFGNAFDTLAKYVKNHGEEQDGEYYCVDTSDEGDVFKVVYNPANADQIKLIYSDVDYEDEEFSFNLTKKKGNYTWRFINDEYKEVSGYFDIEKKVSEAGFLVIEKYDKALEAELPEIEEYIVLVAEICFLSFDIFLIDNNFSFETVKFGIYY